MDKHKYFKTETRNIDIANPSAVTSAYNSGYVLTRIGKGVFNRTRSLRIDLSKFTLSSENNRILRKIRGLHINYNELPLIDYTWQIHKMAKEFYSEKFGENTMSAAKVKEMFQDMNESNLNGVFSYDYDSEQLHSPSSNTENADAIIADSFGNKIGFCLCYKNEEIIHYAYPFYDLHREIPNLGMGMMLLAILWASAGKLKYIYLGSVTTKESKYKLQFSGLEWWDEQKNSWSQDLRLLKEKIGS